MHLNISIVSMSAGIPLLGVADGLVAGFIEHGVGDHDHALDGEEDLAEVGAERVPLLRGVSTMPGPQQTEAYLPVCVEVWVEPVGVYVCVGGRGEGR